MAHCACLAFNPTAIIGLNYELKAPKFEFVSNARPSLFAYPALTKPPTKETVEKVATAVLSTTAKTKAREKTKEKEKQQDGDSQDKDDKQMDADDQAANEQPPKKSGDISPIAGSMSNLTEVIVVPEESKAPKPSTKKREPPSETLPNFSRVTPAQMSHITFPSNGRYQPVRNVSGSATRPKSNRSIATINRGLTNGYAGGGGILLLVDSRPEEEVDLIEWYQDVAPMEVVDVMQEEPAPLVADGPEAPLPEPFEYPFDTDA